MSLLRRAAIGRAKPYSPSKAWALLGSLKANSPGAQPILVRDNAGHKRLCHIDPKSPLRGLARWADFLALEYPWSQSQAAWFLLTGEAPLIAPVTAIIDGPDTCRSFALKISVTAMPHVSRDSVADTYEAAKRWALGTRSGQLPSVRRQMMADYVERLATAEGKRPTWKEAQRRWNLVAPKEWRYEGHWRQVASDHRKEMSASARAKRARKRGRDRASKGRLPGVPNLRENLDKLLD
jgi:hypothetical protein